MKLSETNTPPGSENSVINCQNPSSVSRVGNCSADHAMLKKTHSARTTAKRTRLAALNSISPCRFSTLGSQTLAANGAFHKSFLETRRSPVEALLYESNDKKGDCR